MNTATATRTVSLEALAFAASPVKGERDTEAAIATLVGKPAIFHTFEGTPLVGVIEGPLVGRVSSGGYPIIRFADGRYGRCDDAIVLIDTEV